MCVFALLALALAYYDYKFGIGYSETASLIRLLQIMLIFFVPIPVHIIALILGVVSLFFKDCKKLFSILGTVLNLIFAICGGLAWVFLSFLLLLSGAGGVK